MMHNSKAQGRAAYLPLQERSAAQHQHSKHPPVGRAQAVLLPSCLPRGVRGAVVYKVLNASRSGRFIDRCWGTREYCVYSRTRAWWCRMEVAAKLATWTNSDMPPNWAQPRVWQNADASEHFKHKHCGPCGLIKLLQYTSSDWLEKVRAIRPHVSQILFKGLIRQSNLT